MVLRVAAGPAATDRPWGLAPREPTAVGIGAPGRTGRGDWRVSDREHWNKIPKKPSSGSLLRDGTRRRSVDRLMGLALAHA